VISESRLPDRVKLDLPGAVTVTGALLAVIYTVIEKNIPAAVVGVLLLAAFWVIELRSSAPLAPVRILQRPMVKWGNYAGLLVFTHGARHDLPDDALPAAGPGLFPADRRPHLRRPGPGVRSRRQSPDASSGTSAVARSWPGVCPCRALPPSRWCSSAPTERLAVLIPALFIGFFGHVTSIVAFMVTGTSGLPNKEQGLATGLTSMTQQVGITIDIPVLGSVAATHTMELTGIHLALIVNVAVKLVSVVLIWFGLRLRGDAARQ
jgi:hypothetical protein